MNIKISALLLGFLIILSVFAVPSASAVEWNREAFYQNSIAQYGDIDLSDPQLIDDETFFGVWDGTKWTTESELHYEMYPAMSAIETAAKQGDYVTAKAELLKYYKARYASFNISTPSKKSLSDRERARAESFFDNFMPAYKNSISARILFDETDSWQSTNVLSDVKEIASADEGKIKRFQLVASRKDGYLVEIDSRESEFKPYIRALVDGAYKNYYAVADTYVYGKEPDVIQGNKTTMLVEESVSSIHHASGGYKDEYTKVSFLEFDFSGLTSGNKITEARLYLHGKMMESECPAGIRIPSTTKSVYLMPFIRGATRLAESTLTYTTYKTYTNDYTLWDGLESPQFNKNAKGYDAGNYILIMSRYFDDTTDAYGYTRDETFAWHSLRLLMGMIKANGTFEEMVARDEAGGMTGGPIDGTFYIGQLGFEVPPMIHKLINSEHMTPDVFSTFLKHMYNCTKFLVTQWCNQDEGHNWGTYSTRGLSALTMYFPEFRDAHDPLVLDENGNPVIKKEDEPGGVQGGFIEVAKYRYAYKVGDVIEYNGASVEVSIEYGIEALVNLLRPVVEGDKLNVDPKDYYTKDMVEAMSLNAIFLCGHLNPWFGDWQVGDSASYETDHPSRLKRMLELNDDPELTYLITRGAEGKEPSFQALIHDNVGKVTLRNSWDKNAVAMHIEGSGGKGTHGHNDDLSITMAAYGEYLLIDPRMGFYGTGEPNEAWLSSTRGHNTVIINDTIGKGDKSYVVEEELNRTMVDGVLQGPDVVGELTKYPKSQKTDTPVNFYPENRETNTVYDFVRGETYGYQNNNALASDYFVFRDTLFIHKGYAVVTDYIKPEDLTKENNYEQMWHFLPSANITMDAAHNTIRSNFNNTANIVVATVDDDASLIPSLKPGIVAFGKGNNIDAIYGNFEKNHTGIVTFNSLLYPMTSDEDVEISTEALDLDIDNDLANAFKAQVHSKKKNTTTDIQYFTLFNEKLRKRRTFGDYLTDGVLALSEKSEQGYGAAVLRQGKVLADLTTGSYLIYSKEEVADLGVEWLENTINLATSHTEGEGKVDLTKLSILADYKVDAVLLNGESVPFKQQGKYIYFGSEPLLEENIVPGAPTPVPTARPIVPPTVSKNPPENVIAFEGSAKSFGEGVTAENETLLCDDFRMTYKEWRALKSSTGLSYNEVRPSKVTNRFVHYAKVNSGVEWSGDEATVKRLNLWVWPAYAIDTYEIQSYQNGNWVMVQSGDLNPNAAPLGAISGSNTDNDNANWYSVVLNEGVKTSKLRFVITSFTDSNVGAYIVEADACTTNETNLIGTTEAENDGNKFSIFPQAYKVSNSTGVDVVASEAESIWRGWPTNVKGSYLYDLKENADGNLWYAVRFEKSQHKINRLVLHIAEGTVKEFEIWNSNSADAWSDCDYDLNWEQVARVTGSFTDSVQVDLTDVTAAEYWRIKIVDSEGTVKLSLAQLYEVAEDELAYTLWKGTVAAGKVLTFDLDVFDADLANKTDGTFDVYFALYEGDIMKSITRKEAVLKNEQNYLQYEIPKDAKGKLTVKAFIWDGLSPVTIPAVKQ